jgi:hypothetical protein
VFLVLILIPAAGCFSFAQQIASPLDKREYLVGVWNGEGNGKPGQGSRTFTFSKELDAKVLVTKGQKGPEGILIHYFPNNNKLIINQCQHV